MTTLRPQQCDAGTPSNPDPTRTWNPRKLTWNMKQAACERLVAIIKEYIAAVLSNALDPVDDGYEAAHLSISALFALN